VYVRAGITNTLQIRIKIMITLQDRTHKIIPSPGTTPYTGMTAGVADKPDGSSEVCEVTYSAPIPSTLVVMKLETGMAVITSIPGCMSLPVS
jgi:hypothetical protein